MVESKNRYVELLIKNDNESVLETVFIEKKHVLNVSQVSLVKSNGRDLYYANNCNIYCKRSRGLKPIICNIISFNETEKVNHYKRVITHDNL